MPQHDIDPVANILQTHEAKLRAELAKCQQELEQANQQIEILSRAHVDVVEKNIALAKALKMVEWVDDEYGMWCPWCEAGPFGLRQSLKHHDNCPRQAALDTLEKE